MSHFTLKQGVLHAESVALPAIAEQFATPAYVYSRAALEAALKALTKMSSAMRAVLPDTVRFEALNFEVPANPHQILTSDKVDALISKAINLTTGVTDIVAGARASHESADKRAMTPYRVDCRDVGRVGTELFARFVAEHIASTRGRLDIRGAGIEAFLAKHLPSANDATATAPDNRRTAGGE